MQKYLYSLLVGLFLIGQLNAQDDPRPTTQTFLLQNATIITAPGDSIVNGSVLVKNGLIEAVGKNISAPFDAKVIKADSMYIYAGFISGASHIGVPKVDPKKASGARRGSDDDKTPPGNPTNEKAGIQPERAVRSVLDASDNSIENMREIGFTAAHVVPDGKMLPGKGAIILLAGESVNDLIIMENTALFAQLQGASGVMPATVIGVMSKMRDLYRQAQQSQQHRSLFASNTKGMSRPVKDPVLEAFYPVIEGEQAVFMKAQNGRDISRALDLQRELGYNLVLTDVEKGWNYLDDLKKHKVFLSLDLPKAKEEKKKDDDTPETEAYKELEKRRAAEQQAYESQGKTFVDAGIQFGFSTLEVKPKEVKANLLRLIEGGLSKDQALAALTTQAADLLGLSNMMGSVEKGKMANLMITDAPYFDKDANIRYMMVEGELFEYEAKSKKKKKSSSDSNVKADVAGTWSYEMNIPGQTMEGTFVFNMDEDEVSGQMSDPMGSGEMTDLDDVSLDGDTLTFTLTTDQGGATMVVDFTLTVDGESYEGSMSVGQYGSFDVEGVRVEKPEN